MIVCCTNNTRDAQFGLFVCACVYFWFQHHQILVQCSRCRFPHSSVANAAPAALWIHLVLFLMLWLTASSGKERCWKSEKTAQFAFRLFTLRYRGNCANVLAVRSNCCLLVPELVMLFVRLSIYLSECLSVCLSDYQFVWHPSFEEG